MSLKLLFFPLSLLVSLVILIWMAKPEWDNYKSIQLELTKKQKELDKIKKGVASIGVSFNDFSEVDEQTKSLIKYSIPDGINNEDLLAQVGKSANSSRVLLVSTKTSQDNKRRRSLEEEEDEKIIMNSEIEVVGNYPNVREFIVKLERQNRLTVLENVSISKIDDLRIANEAADSTQEATDSAEGEGDVQADDLSLISADLVRARISFKFYGRQQEETQKKLSQMIESKDPVFDSLLAGKFKVEVVDKFKENITTEVFAPVSSGTIGKQNLFLREK